MKDILFAVKPQYIINYYKYNLPFERFRLTTNWRVYRMMPAKNGQSRRYFVLCPTLPPAQKEKAKKHIRMNFCVRFQQMLGNIPGRFWQQLQDR
jgi:hypothetical protein